MKNWRGDERRDNSAENPDEEERTTVSDKEMERTRRKRMNGTKIESRRKQCTRSLLGI